ncbi:unnamed protein product [Hyaloperonospora brassicae]|uniref:Myb-like domain-containing protein n=1 Tax=Hyaloperonospora brassicae TaxID=162125 RepID=A0AAV0SWN5_HYABA|nr:unnamed protein product [Hyaloperonospora brassicae]
MAGWEKVATTLNGCSAFKTHHLKGPIAKNRFERLVERHRSWVKNGSKPEDVPSEDAAFQSVMMRLVPKLDAAEAEPVTQTLGKRGRPRKVRPVETLAPATKKASTVVACLTIAPSPVGPQPSSPSTSLLVDPEDQALPIATKATRQRFTPRDDLLLAKYVKQSLPFRAKFGAISAAWDDVASKLDSNPEFSKDSIKGPVVRYRFENLVLKYRERVKRNNGRVVGAKGTPAGELEVLMTELVTLLDGGDPVSAALLAQNVAILTGSVNEMRERKFARTSRSQDFVSTKTNSGPSSPGSTASDVSPDAPQSSIIHTLDSQSLNTLTSMKQTVVKALSPTSIAGFETLVQKMIEQQNRAIKQMVSLQRDERRLETERREKEFKLQREEWEKDRKQEREEREKEREARENEQEKKREQFEQLEKERGEEREERKQELEKERKMEREEREKEREERKKEREEREKEREEREKEREEREKEREERKMEREEREKEREERKMEREEREKERKEREMEQEERKMEREKELEEREKELEKERGKEREMEREELEMEREKEREKEREMEREELEMEREEHEKERPGLIVTSISAMKTFLE